MPNLLIVSNCPSRNTRLLQNAVLEGCQHPDINGVITQAREPLETDHEDLLWAHGLILGTTENFGYMSGQIKDFFERIYYPCLEKTEGLPVAIFIKGGLDGLGARTSVERIITGLKWKQVQPPLVMTGEFKPDFVDQCRDLGTLMAAGLESGVF
ncbi:MAG: flavodoxin family protein [Gammaproteobacteria bacterium]|nr:flavodoxin family protein [Gammaproteobacteria bacterium]